MLVPFTLCLAAVQAQSIQVLSEFRRVDAKGAIVKADEGGKPREILSPGLMRNTFYSLRVVVDPPKGKWFQFEIAQNPEGLGVTVYKELPGTQGRLEKVAMPVHKIGERLEVYWLDLWIPPRAPVRRIRIEAQLHDGEGWRIAPMEVRVLKGIAPQPKRAGAQLPAWADSADAPARQAMREFVCDEVPKPALPGLTVSALVRRNAMQDVAIARALQLQWGRTKLQEAMVKAAGGEDPGAWCGARRHESADGPEWYLRVRDFLYREASR
ncbi:MAG: hypothetical protein JNK48_34390 [Bryobacterales bacterium]|nr:hypothetical protein [Bryobacterales bacterium]